MTRTVVHHEAGPRFDDLAERLQAVVEPIAPLVEAVTRLTLPDTVVIRTMTPRQWLAVHRRQDRRQLRAEARELDPSRCARRSAKAETRSLRKARRSVWPGIGAQVLEPRQGHPEVAVLPQALREAGRLNDEPVLHKVVAHELTHIAQYATTDGAAWRLMKTFYADQRGIADRDFSFLLEGHAYWADRQITTKLFGAPVPTAEISPHATLRYRSLAETSHHREVLKRLSTASDSVAQIIDAAGLDVFNQVWTTPSLVPKKSETRTPELWCARFG
ncbi:hypothetical protein KBP30_00935 [Streptomyces sp. Go40/10]|uniref:hypothetical protein n=1 Tax=Streptomyces sp. Go40/10 TaxID=2825844 RepID=UPI001E2B32DA|nr:hypothetical protein [Streptomyces sp. Go40/10]UFQ99874.1 hypothetical protein KBP30_00935 [Streptomyces sp. Go40/10]